MINRNGSASGSTDEKKTAIEDDNDIPRSIHLSLSRLQKCPVIHASHSFSHEPNQINRKALILGLLVGMSCFALLYQGTDDLSFSIISGVVAGIFATHLSNPYLAKKRIPEDLPTNTVSLQSCPMGSRAKLSDDGFFGPKSITWQTGSDPSLLIAGVAAGLLQMLHPKVVKLIEISGGIYRDPKRRAERTALHGSSIIYGDKKTAEAASQAFKKLHDSLTVKDLITGEEYSASQPELLLWVHNSLTWMILRTFKMYGPPLTAEEENQYIIEQHISANLTDIKSHVLPNNTQELEAYMVSMIDQLALNKNSIRFRDFLFKKKCPRSLAEVIERVVGTLSLDAGTRLMLPIHQELFGFRFTKLGDMTVSGLTNIMIKLLRYGFPPNKAIEKTREKLAEHSYGSQFKR